MNDAAIIHGRIPTYMTWWPAFGLACVFALAVYGGLYFSLQSMMKTDAKIEQYVIIGCVALALTDWFVLAQVLSVRARNRNLCGRVVLHRDELELRGAKDGWALHLPLPETPVRYTLLHSAFYKGSPEGDSSSAHVYAELGNGAESAVIECLDFTNSRTRFARSSFKLVTDRPKSSRMIQVHAADFGRLIGHITAIADRDRN